LRDNVVKSANRPAKPQADIDRGLDDKLWSIIQDCWSQEPSNRPTAEEVSSRLCDVKGCPFESESEFSHLHTTLKQAQDRNISINKERSAIGRAGWISPCNQANIVATNYTETTLNDSIAKYAPIAFKEKNQVDFPLVLE
jgi:hypothetical protein